MALVGNISGSGGVASTVGVSGSVVFGRVDDPSKFPSLPGSDVVFFVSGNFASKPATSPNTAVRGTTVFGGDVVISGTLFGGSPLYIGSPVIFGGSGGLTGSLTETTAGTSYLVAGANITVDSGSSPGQIIISSTGGGGGGGTNFFLDTAGAGKIYTTASSVAFPFGEAGINEAADKGTDVLFFVSGSNVGTASALFSGRLVTSGNIIVRSVTESSVAPNAISLSSAGVISGSSNIQGGGDLTIAGDAAINGGDLTTTSTGTATLFNTNATAVNIAGDATAVQIGATSGNTTVRNNLTVTGDLTVNGTTVTVDATTVSVEDPVIGLGFTSGSVTRGSPGDRGFIGGLDGENNVAFIWDETADGFSVFRTTSSTTSSLPVDVVDYSTFRSGKLELGGGTSAFLTSSDGTNLVINHANTTTFRKAGTAVVQITDNGTGEGFISGNSSDNTISSLWISGSVLNLGHTRAATVGPVPNGVKIFGGGAEGASLRVGGTPGNTTFSILSHGGTGASFPLTLSGSTVSINAHTSNVSNGVVIQGGSGATNLARFWGSTSNVNIDLGGTTSTVFSAPLSTSPNAEITLTGSNINLSHGFEDGKGVTFQRGGTKYGSIQYVSVAGATYAQFGNEFGATNVRIGSSAKVNLSGSIAEIVAASGAAFFTTTNAASTYAGISSGSFSLGEVVSPNTARILSVNANSLLLGSVGSVYLTGSSARISVGGSNAVGFQRDGTSFVQFSSGSAGATQNDTTISTSLSTRVDLFNTVATTVNFAGAATALEIGATSGTTSINNNLTVDGNTTLGNAETDTTTVAGSLAVNGTSGASTNKITSTQTSFDLLNTTVTTLNIGGAATAISVGAANGTLTSNVSIVPAATNSYDLGTPSLRWRNMYTGDLHLKNERGNWTIIEEREFLSITNNITGKRYKFVLQEIE